jgi:hypothetical protein
MQHITLLSAHTTVNAHHEHHTYQMSPVLTQVSLIYQFNVIHKKRTLIIALLRFSVSLVIWMCFDI